MTIGICLIWLVYSLTAYFYFRKLKKDPKYNRRTIVFGFIHYVFMNILYLIVYAPAIKAVYESVEVT